MNLHIRMDLDVNIKGHWVPFQLFKEGKYKEQIEEYLVSIPHSNGMDNNLGHLLILAELLGTQIRHFDEEAGVVYKVRFKRGAVTTLASFVAETDQLIKIMEIGAQTTEDFKSELAHVLEL